MLEAGAVQVNGRVRVNETQLAQMQLPDTIHGLLLARLDRLTPAGRDLLQAASVVGRQFSLDPLQVVSGELSRPHILNLLTDISQTEMTRLVTADPEWIYLFRHALTHEVAYESLPFARRQMLHALVADWLEERYGDNLQPFYAALAYHYGRAANQEKCLRFAIQAGDAARAIFANQEAVELYTLAQKQLQALGEEERWDTAVHLYLNRAEALRLIGDFDTAAADAARAAQHARSHNAPEQLAQSYNLLAEIKWRQVKLDETQILTSIVIDELAEQISVDELARAHHWAGWADASSGNWEQALTQLEYARQLCISTANNYRLAMIWETIAYVHFLQKDLEKALQAMQQNARLSRSVSTPVNAASALNNVALIQLQLGRAEDALHSVNEAIDLARDSSRVLLAQLLGNRAETLTYLGRFRDANRDFEEAIHLFSTMNDESGLLEVYLLKGHEYHIPLGEWEKAAYWLELAEKIITTRQNGYPEPELNVRLLVSLARVDIYTQSYKEALRRLNQAKIIVQDKKLEWWRPVVLHFLGAAYKYLENNKAAKEQFKSSLAAIAQNGCPDYKPLTLLRMAELAQNPVEQKRLLKDCVAAAKRRARLPDKVYCLKTAGYLLTTLGDERGKREGESLIQEAQALEQQIQPLSPEASGKIATFASDCRFWKTPTEN